MTSAVGVTLAVVALGVPALAFAVWPLLRRPGAGAGLLPLPADPREQLAEDRRAALRTLRELEFEHAAGHVSDEDYADLRARYEAETAAILSELDRLGAPVEPARPPATAVAPTAERRAGWRHPAAVAVAGVALVTFGVALGVGIVRYTEPDANAGAPMPGSRPLAGMDAPGAANAPRGPVTPAMLQGMLEAARSSLFAGRYSEAMAAYQAVLKRDPANVDAMTHLGLIAAIAAQGQHGPEMVSRALELFERALALEPNYPPALLYRGQVLYEVKKDVPGAIASWEKFLAVTPPGDDRDRVAKLLADARAQAGRKR
ncbi:MAG TPA: tetratricopeptide repeat protein [Methylomirabilota bacterium]|nr:tetratricopeptide repeat protein [Methylomirabilota bacterium]